MRHLPRAEIVLPFVVVLGAVLLAASEFMTAFEFTPPGGEAQDSVSSADRHGYSMLILAICAIVATVTAVFTGMRPVAVAVAVIGGVALLLFLILDLPDAGTRGSLQDFITARAEPRAGFWTEALGATILALGGAAFATLDPHQLQALRRARVGKRAERTRTRPETRGAKP
jgi:hypothetical protein